MLLKYIKRMEAWEWVGVVTLLLIVAIPVALFFGLEKKANPNSEDTSTVTLVPATCNVRSVVWFDDNGKAIGAKAVVCEEKKEGD